LQSLFIPFLLLNNIVLLGKTLKVRKVQVGAIKIVPKTIFNKNDECCKVLGNSHKHSKLQLDIYQAFLLSISFF